MQRLVLPQLPELAAKLDLNPADGHLITYLHHHGPTPMTALAQALGIPLSTTTHRIDKLVKTKVASRKHSLEDRRRVEVSLTKKGTTFADALNAMRLKVAADMLLPLAAGEQNLLIEILTKINSR